MKDKTLSFFCNVEVLMVFTPRISIILFPPSLPLSPSKRVFVCDKIQTGDFQVKDGGSWMKAAEVELNTNQEAALRDCCGWFLVAGYTFA